MLKRTKLRKKSKNPYAVLRSKAWDVFSLFVRTDEGFVCYTCGKKLTRATSNAGHYEHVNCLDFERKNIHCQCVHCNRYMSGNRNAYAIHLEKDYGYGILQELSKLKDKIHYFKVSELEAIIKKYASKIQS